MLHLGLNNIKIVLIMTKIGAKDFFETVKREAMVWVAVVAALIVVCVVRPSVSLLGEIDWRTLGTLFLMLTVLEGFKKEKIFNPIIRLAGRIKSAVGLGLFLVFAVFFTSMFVTNDVSLIIFVPLTIFLFRAAGKEKYILPILAMQNIAAIRGSLLTPFGSPQNLFIFGQSGVSVWSFIGYMAPIWAISGVLLVCFVAVLFAKNIKQATGIPASAYPADSLEDNTPKRLTYLFLFLIVIWMIVSRFEGWYYIAAMIVVTVLIFDAKVLLKTDYLLLVTFFCFFVFSSTIASSEAVANFLQKIVVGREYFVSILLSQAISNVPAAIVLYPFAINKGALLYGLDSAGLVTIIGSLASVINYRIYVREYPKGGLKFLAVFEIVSLIFFAIMVAPGYFLCANRPM